MKEISCSHPPKSASESKCFLSLIHLASRPRMSATPCQRVECTLRPQTQRSLHSLSCTVYEQYDRTPLHKAAVKRRHSPRWRFDTAARNVEASIRILEA